eukprot:scaffold12183_cov68-Phaeocystis_antarctica.AAC.20
MSKLPPHCTMNDMACVTEAGGRAQLGGRAAGLRVSECTPVVCCAARDSPSRRSSSTAAAR